MINILKKYFGSDVKMRRIEEKPSFAIYLYVRDMYAVDLYGLSFVIIRIKEDDKFGISALKKQITKYSEGFDSNIVFGFDYMDKRQRDMLLKEHIPFISREGQVYLPFAGIVLSENFRIRKQIQTEKMMPATQALFLYLLYGKEEFVKKSTAAEGLDLTRTSITRASDQLAAMDLIEQKKAGKEVYIKLRDIPDIINKAKPFLIDPVQERLCIYKESLPSECILAGESALSGYSMLNEPQIEELAIYKGSVDKSLISIADPRWDTAESIINLEFWKYDPKLFAINNRVDPVSLLCSLSHINDERVEMAIEEMMEKLKC